MLKSLFISVVVVVVSIFINVVDRMFVVVANLNILVRHVFEKKNSKKNDPNQIY